MPAGDVVKVTADRLDAALRGRVLEPADQRWPSARGVDHSGRTVGEVKPYAKHLLTRLDDGTTLHTHLRMEGQWRIARTGTDGAVARSTDVRAVLANEVWTCVGERLGMLDVVRTRDEQVLLGHLGPDVLADDFLSAPDSGVLLALARLRDAAATGGFPAQATAGGPPARVARGLPLADALLDQRGVAGLGTIYTAESLFAQGMWPWTQVSDVSDRDLEALLRTARGQMLRSVAEGVGTVRRHVHGRARRACHRCGTPVAVARANEAPFERPIFYCPSCQKP